MPGGRPSKLTKKNLKKARLLCEKGMSDEQLAIALDVTRQTIDNWKKIPEFFAALKAGKDISDERVVNSLYHRACGYSHPEDKIFNEKGEAMIVPTTKHYPPDTAAAVFWLKNRQPDQWRDKTEVAVTGIEDILKALDDGK